MLSVCTDCCAAEVVSGTFRFSRIAFAEVGDGSREATQTDFSISLTHDNTLGLAVTTARFQKDKKVKERHLLLHDDHVYDHHHTKVTST